MDCKLKSKFASFADDARVVEAFEYAAAEYAGDNDHNSKWFVFNNFHIKLKKSDVAPFGSGKPSDIKKKEFNAPFDNSIKFLGVHLDGRFKFQPFTNHVFEKTRQILLPCLQNMAFIHPEGTYFFHFVCKFFD